VAVPDSQVDDLVSAGLAESTELLDLLVGQATASEPGVDIEPVSLQGMPAPSLLEAAADADMLVVGSRGRGGFAALLLGSVSQQCVHEARCPVLVVPAQISSERQARESDR
ncbi:MAG: universal stress protein, partial [Gaiellaceae bacterium]